MSDSSDIEQGTPAQILFYQTLIRMINTESHTGSIGWLADGRNGFVILQKKYFTGNILRRYFGQAKFTSFTRRLKRWKFRRASNSGAFVHEKFRRDMVLDFDDASHRPLTSESTKALPLKKRRHSTSPVLGDDAIFSCPAKQARPSSQNIDDVNVMPEIMRTINRQKRHERGNDGHFVASPEIPMAVVNLALTYQARPNVERRRAFDQTVQRVIHIFPPPPMSNSSLIHQGRLSERFEQNVEAAQTLASLGRKESPGDSFDQLMASNRRCFGLSPNSSTQPIIDRRNPYRDLYAATESRSSMDRSLYNFPTSPRQQDYQQGSSYRDVYGTADSRALDNAHFNFPTSLRQNRHQSSSLRDRYAVAESRGLIDRIHPPLYQRNDTPCLCGPISSLESSIFALQSQQRKVRQMNSQIKSLLYSNKGEGCSSRLLTPASDFRSKEVTCSRVPIGSLHRNPLGNRAA